MRGWGRGWIGYRRQISSPESPQLSQSTWNVFCQTNLHGYKGKVCWVPGKYLSLICCIVIRGRWHLHRKWRSPFQLLPRVLIAHVWLMLDLHHQQQMGWVSVTTKFILNSQTFCEVFTKPLLNLAHHKADIRSAPLVLVSYMQLHHQQQLGFILYSPAFCKMT